MCHLSGAAECSAPGTRAEYLELSPRQVRATAAHPSWGAPAQSENENGTLQQFSFQIYQLLLSLYIFCMLTTTTIFSQSTVLICTASCHFQTRSPVLLRHLRQNVPRATSGSRRSASVSRTTPPTSATTPSWAPTTGSPRARRASARARSTRPAPSGRGARLRRGRVRGAGPATSRRRGRTWPRGWRTTCPGPSTARCPSREVITALAAVAWFGTTEIF